MKEQLITEKFGNPASINNESDDFDYLEIPYEDGDSVNVYEENIDGCDVVVLQYTQGAWLNISREQLRELLPYLSRYAAGGKLIDNGANMRAL